MIEFYYNFTFELCHSHPPPSPMKKHADLMAEDTEQMSLMHSAVMGGYINCVLLLIDKGAPNDWPDKVPVGRVEK